MRVTTSMIFDTGVGEIQKQNARLLDTQQQVATGRRILRPSDDPVASARALEISQSQSVNSLYAANQGYANDALKLVDSKLSAATDILTYVRTRAVESGNGIYSQSEHTAIGEDLAQQFDQLLSIANSKDATGDYVFGGYRSNAAPFAGSLAGGIQYQGDQGARALQISASRTLPITSSGDEIFNTVRAPAGSAFALSNTANSGAAQVTGLSVASSYGGHAYAINVTSGPTYSVVDTTTGAVVPSTTSTSGSDTTLNFGAISLTLNGTPAAGDSFNVSSVASTFDILGNFVGALRSGNKAAIQFGGTQTISGMDGSQDNVSRVQAGVGSRMVEVETQQNVNGNLDLQYSEALSRLQDADYAEAVSNLSQQQIFLQAAQQSFLKVSNLSLFNYLS